MVMQSSSIGAKPLLWLRDESGASRGSTLDWERSTRNTEHSVVYFL